MSMHQGRRCFIYFSIDVVTGASRVLKNLLATKTGQAACTHYKSNIQDHLFQYLHPFKAPRKKVPAFSSQLSSRHCS